MRRTSVSLPTKQVAYDPHEKQARYGRKKPFILDSLQAAWMRQGQRTRWLKATAILAFVFILFYYISPTGVDIQQTSTGNTNVNTNDNVPSSPSPNSNEGQDKSQGLGQAPTDSSYGTDRCERSSSPDKPIVQYVAMIDAGSTGSRIHVYKFNNCGETPELEHEEFKMTEKNVGGLSNYKDEPEAAAKTLDPLLQVALDYVPDVLKGCTPIAVKATAGLRMVGPEAADRILAAVRNRLESQYPFPVVSKENDGVVIMDGSLEGVYAWITANYLLGKIGGPDRSETAATFDLGGGSTQIVFEPTFKEAAAGGMPEKLKEGDHKYNLDFGGQKFELYQHSHLGYGLMAARDAIHRAILTDLYEDKQTTDFLEDTIVHPCLPPGIEHTVKNLKFEDGGLKGTYNTSFKGPTEPSSSQCRAFAEKILKKDAECTLSPCSFNGVHQPSLAKTFSKEDVYVFSYFYDRTKALGMPDSFTIRELHDLASKVCHGPDAWDVFESISGALTELEAKPMRCLDLSFMLALLHTGYDMPIDREVKIAKKIKGNELGWCLGAR